MMQQLISPQSLRIGRLQRTWTSRPVQVDPLTSAFHVRIARPPRNARGLWTLDDRIAITLRYVTDGVLHAVHGSATGGVQKEDYCLSFVPTYGLGARGYEWMATHAQDENHWHHGVPMDRAGQFASRRLAWLEVTCLDGAFRTDCIEAWAGSVAVLPGSVHHSVAVDNKSYSLEVTGGGTLTVNLAAVGSTDLGAFWASQLVGAAANTQTGTYDGSGTGVVELWDRNDNVGGIQLESAGYAKAAIGMGSRAYNGTSTNTNPLRQYVGVITFTGSHQTTIEGNIQTTTGSTSPSSVTCTSVDAADMVVDSLLLGDFTTATAPSIGANQSVQNTDDGTTYFFRQSSQSGGDGGVMSWTNDGGDVVWTYGAVVIKASGGAPPSPGPALQSLAQPLRW